MENPGSKAADARQRAEAKFTKAKQRDEEVMDFQRRRQEAEEAKLLRLRSLRLAKEAADRENRAKAKAEAEAAPSAGKGRPGRRRQPKSGASEQ